MYHRHIPSCWALLHSVLICLQRDRYAESCRLTSTDVGDQVSHTPGLEQLGEQAGQVGLNLDVCCLDQGADVVSLQQQWSSEAILSTCWV